MKILFCREAGCDCHYIAKGETEEEVMKDAADHRIKEHGKKEEEDMSQMKEMLRALIHDSGSASTDTTTALRQPTEPG